MSMLWGYYNMSANYEKVKKYYDTGLWPKAWVWDAVGKWITAEEYKLITGEDYPSTRPV